MKKLFKQLIFSQILILMFALSVFAQEKKSKTVSEKYAVSASDKLEIDNRYGKVDVKTWDKNEVTVEVEILAWAKSEDKAQDILDNIEIKFGKSGNVIRFETEIENNSFNSHGNNKGFEINYTLNVPVDFDLQIENRYGNVFLADYKGKLQLDLKYGSLATQKITGSKEKSIEVQYGKYDIDEISQGKLEFKYSSGEIGNAGKITLYQGYGNVKFKSVEDVEMDVKYGSFEAKEAGKIKGTIGYSTFRLKKLKSEIDLSIKYGGGFEVNEVSPDFKRIQIEGGYSSFDITFPQNVNFEYEISTSYGSFKNGLSNANVSKEIIENTKQYHEGKVGSGGKVVHIETKYGNVRLEN